MVAYQKLRTSNGPDAQLATRKLAILYFRTGDMERAEQEFHLLKLQNPKDAVTLTYLGNISYRLGTLQAFDKAGKAFGDDKEAAETLARMEEHLKENKVPPDGTKCQVGKKLTINPASETFIGESASFTG